MIGRVMCISLLEPKLEPKLAVSAGHLARNNCTCHRAGGVLLACVFPASLGIEHRLIDDQLMRGIHRGGRSRAYLWPGEIGRAHV